MEVRNQLHASDAFTPEKELVLHPLDRRLDGHHSQCRRDEEKTSAPAGNRIPVIQPVA
jgi:hypothetical protein